MDVNFFLMQKGSSTEGAFHALHFGQGLDFVLPWQNDHEFITTVADDSIVFTQLPMDGLGHLFQNLAAEQVAVRIYDALEIVQIKKHER